MGVGACARTRVCLLQVRRRLLQDRRPLQLLAALTPGRPRAAPAGPGPPCAEPITTPPVSRRARFRAAGRDRHRVEARRAWSDRVVGIQSESGQPPEPSPSHLSESSFRATFSFRVTSPSPACARSCRWPRPVPDPARLPPPVSVRCPGRAAAAAGLNRDST